MDIREWRRERASRRADRGTSPDIQSDKAFGQMHGSGGFFSKNQPPRP